MKLLKPKPEKTFLEGGLLKLFMGLLIAFSLDLLLL